MELEEKIELNKKLRKYEGYNTFLLSLKKSLKSYKYLERVEVGKRKIKVLSEKQYSAAKSTFSREITNHK